MEFRCVVFFSCLLIYQTFALNECELAHKGKNYEFPEKFAFGVSTAAFQIEGAWNEDGKAPSIWDTFTHNHFEMIEDWSNADDSTESYHRFEQDLAALKELKVDFYRFSISWPRVLPRVTTAVKNEKGIAYYNKVIDQLIANNITPMVTMLQFDMPEELTEYGGFMNITIIDYFQSYADFLFETFGDRVKVWITFNEPYMFCGGYAKSNFPPSIHKHGVGDYICMDNLLRAHAITYRLYKRKYFSEQQGKIGIVEVCRFFYKKKSETPDEVIDRALQYELGFMAEPIFGKTGNYPSIMIADIGNNSLKDGYPSSRLPVINDEWSKIIKGSADFLGINYYTSAYVDISTKPQGEVPSLQYDSKLIYGANSDWRRAKASWIYCVPNGLEDLLKWIRDSYENVEVFITENGWSDDGRLDDSDRTDYIKAHLQAVLNAINDGCNVTHYSYWTLMDNYNWINGYAEKFGLYFVNMTSANKDRIIKDSAKYYRSVIESHKISTTSGGPTMRQYNCLTIALLSAFIFKIIL